jgi:predicted phage tail protein
VLSKFNDIEGSKGSKSKAETPQRASIEEPNTLRSKDVIRLVDMLSEGEIYSIDQIYFDDTPILAANGAVTATGVYLDYRKGTTNQTYMPGVPSVQTEIGVGIELKSNQPIIRTIYENDIDVVYITISVPSLSYTNTTNGDIVGTSVSLYVELQAAGTSYVVAVPASKTVITGKTSSTYKVQYRVELKGANAAIPNSSAPYNIRVTRLTPDSNTTYLLNRTIWESFTKVIEHKLSYPGWAVAALTFDSALYGSSVPNRSYQVKGIKIKIPVNYDPFARTYSGSWNGTFKTDWSNNPAWVLYDLLSNNRYGLGNYINANEIDKYGLYSIAQYCDELVPNGKGGYEPRFVFNGIIQTEEDALKVLQMVASCFRGMVYWGADATSGIITCSQDRPADPIKLFTNANVVDGVFNYSSAPLEAQHSLAYVTWNDPEDRYNPAIEVVESPIFADIKIHRPLDVYAIGATSRGQAVRAGKWILDTELNQAEQVSFKTGLADADIRPGDIVKIADKDYADVRYGGRIKAINSAWVQLDDTIQMDYGRSYSIDIVLKDGTLINRGLNFNANETDTFYFSTSLSPLPAINASWIITSSDLSPRQFKIVSVKEEDDLTYSVSGIFHDPNKFARVEYGLNFTSPKFTTITSDVVPAPTNLQYSEYMTAFGALFRSNCLISWTAVKDSRVVKYQLEVKSPGADFRLFKETAGLNAVIEGTQDGTWAFRVRSVDAFNKFSQWTTIENVTLYSNNAPPEDVQGFKLNVLQDKAILSWNPVNSKNLSHYEIRFAPELVNPLWVRSSLEVEKVSKTTSISVPSKKGSYLIKAVTFPTEQNPQGVYSPNAVWVPNEIDWFNNLNYVDAYDESINFRGFHVATKVSGGNLELDGFNSSGRYYHERLIDLGANYVSRVSLQATEAGNLLTNNVDLWPDVDKIASVDGLTEGLWKTVHLMRGWNFHPAKNLGTPWGGSAGTNMFANYLNPASSSFSKVNVTTTTTSIVAPDDVSTAVTISETATTGQHTIYQSLNLTNNTKYIVGGFIRKDPSYTSFDSFQAGVASQLCNFSLDGLVSSPVPGHTNINNSAIFYVSNGFYMYFVDILYTGTTGFKTVTPFVFNNNDINAAQWPNYAGSTSRKCHIFGMFCAPYTGSLPAMVTDEIPIGGSGDIKGRVLQFITELYSYRSDVTPSIERLQLTVDMPDFIQSAANTISLGTGDTVVTFPTPFKSDRPVVIITPQSMQTGDYYTISAINAASFTVNFYNASNTRIVRTFDYYAKGYGQQVT